MNLALPLLLALLAVVPSLRAADQPLFGPGLPWGVEKIDQRDASATVVKDGSADVLSVATGHRKPWPGITLLPPEGQGCWNLAANAQVVLELKNTGENPVEIRCRVDNPKADGLKHCLNASLSLEPGKSGALQISLLSAGGDNLGGRLFGMKGNPAAAAGTPASDFDAAQVNALVVFVVNPSADHRFEILGVRATGEYRAPTASVTDAKPFFPFIDAFGQYKHRDWPGKTKSPADLTTRRDAEASALRMARPPASWDKFGGWAGGPALAATGAFRAEKVAGKWWLVDPEGRLFFSQGIDCVGQRDTTPIDERESWFDAFPGSQPEFRPFSRKQTPLLGHYAGRETNCFSFIAANLFRKYGPDWEKKYPALVHDRLKAWGVNTLGNWSEASIFRLRLTPYVDNIGSWGAKPIQGGGGGSWGKFPDVFDPGFAELLRKHMAAKTGKSADDPWCIGYFVDNELSWGDATSLALGALQSPADQPAKQAFLADLRAKYGSIEKLNAAWSGAHASWEALAQTQQPPDKERAREDLLAFNAKLAETYFRTARDAVKAVAPKRLYLGCRFATSNDVAARAAAQYCDVVSYNLYRHEVESFRFPGGDKPVIIGEFHFGALDRGLFHQGLVPMANQADRAAAYANYMLGAARNPALVGAHWFQWVDEPVTGRSYDEENYQIGFVDVADTPYPEMVAASRKAAEALYQTRSGSGGGR